MQLHRLLKNGLGGCKSDKSVWTEKERLARLSKGGSQRPCGLKLFAGGLSILKPDVMNVHKKYLSRGWLRRSYVEV